MQKRVLSMTLAVPLAFVLGSIGSEFGGPAAQSPSAAADLSKLVGVVQIELAAAAYPKWTKGLEALQAESEAYLAEIKKQEKLADGLREKRNQFEAGSRESLDAAGDFNAAVARLKWLSEQHMPHFQTKKAALYEAVYRDIDQEIAALAKEKGVMLVLRQRPLPAVDGTVNPIERHEEYDGRVLLHASPALDLTPDLIRILKTK